MREKPLILIVDDDSAFREVVAEKLRAGGYDIAEAVDGEEGCVRAKELRPDLILMDVKMPKLDGIQAMLKIAKDVELRAIPVVFLTAFGDTQPEIYRNDRRFAQEIGALDYIVKTQDLDKIVEKVREVLHRT
jgi:CheY-like chemotaxis protein